jgi:sugar lactone lactonase YvrE
MPRAVHAIPAVALAVTALTTWTMSAQTAVTPTNDLPNPYRTIEHYFTLPEGRPWGSSSTVDIDRDGKSIWVAERCGANSCAGSDRPAVYKFDASGKVLASWGAGMFIFPHGIHIDRQGNVWIVDGQGNRDPGRGARGGRGAGGAAAGAAPTLVPERPQSPQKPMGHQVLKLSPDGKVLLALGTAGEAGNDESHFNQPSDVVTSPVNGDIFVADGHGGASNARIVKFDKNGKFIKAWGHMGSGPGEIDIPHAIAMDSKGRLFLADRNNSRLQIFDQDGNFIAEWKQFSRPSGLFITKDDMLYVADSESSNSRNHGEWKRGIRIGSIKDGKVVAFIPDMSGDPNNGPLASTSGAEGVAVDAQGNVYGAEVGNRAVKKYVKK